MQTRKTTFLAITLLTIVLLAVGGTVGAMALTHSGFWGNNNSPYGMMNGQPYPGTMMGSNQQLPVQRGTPAAASTHLTMDIVINQAGMQRDWPAFSPSNLVAPANSLVTLTIRDDDLGNTTMPQNSPLTTTQGIVGTNATVDGRAYSTLAATKIAHTFTLPQLTINVPLPGDGASGKDYNTVIFTFRTGAPGTYLFRCLDPCGTGPMGMMGPMMTQGYMLGTLTVQ